MKRSLLATFIACAITSTGWALEYNQTVVAIFGSGNPNAGWATGRGGDRTLGLRAKNLDDGSTPNTEGVYTFAPGYSANNSALALWNFEFSINSGSQSLSSYDFYLGVDMDPTLGVNYVDSLINPLTYLEDNSYGSSGTLNGLGTESSFADALLEGHTVAKNSLNIAFAGLDPRISGTYDYRLFAIAKDMGNSPNPSLGEFDWSPAMPSFAPVADVNIRVTVPDGGGTLAMLGLSLVGLAGISRRRIA